LYGAETGTFRVDQKDVESIEMWCWRRMEKISWTDHVRNEEVLLCMAGHIFAHLFGDVICVIIYVLIIMNLWVVITQYCVSSYMAS
jgi:hypothetical protein